MALTVLLYVDERVVDGTEAWWDLADTAVTGVDTSHFPLLQRVDPYGEVVFEHDALVGLATEADTLARVAPRTDFRFLSSVSRLALRAAGSPGARLVFLGD